jgi:hypothetical protein
LKREIKESKEQGPMIIMKLIFYIFIIRKELLSKMKNETQLNLMKISKEILKFNEQTTILRQKDSALKQIEKMLDEYSALDGPGLV